MDINALKKKRAQLKDKLNRNVSLWKPPIGESKVRILPYKYNEKDPFTILHWHWNVGRNSILCLKRNFDEECPVCQLASIMWQSEQDDDRELAKKLFAKERFYVPVVVRGEEDQGPKLWGFGQNIFDTLTSRLDDTGDYTDIENGRDIIIVYQSPTEAKNKYGKLDVSFAFNQSTVATDDKILKTLLDDQIEVYELYPRKTYDEVKKIISDWLNPDTSSKDKSFIGTVTDTEDANTEKVDDQDDKKTVEDEDSFEEKYKKLLEDES